ncbi:alpha-amylase family protein [Cellulomonas sp. HZM]|uniref:alpha-amylase family protein n=1 Tax=Cellulomonas sp. HZM TaxID=1454010 RepID=UPI00068CFBED|nr:alpha-amylase family protein [Cellulomonas sp. HZM]
MSGWREHAIWWAVYPLGFVGAEPTKPSTGATPDGAVRDAAGEAAAEGVRHRLGHVVAWLDHAVRLGCSGIQLGPVFSSSTHGYDTTDFFSVDPRLGDDDDLRHLCDEAHARGLRVLLDGVFNHVGTDHPLFQAALADRDAPENALFRIHHDVHDIDAQDRPTWDCFEGHRHLATLDHSSPQVADLVVDVMSHWLAAGADGWRLDAAYAVPTGFWAPVLDRVRARHPDAYVVGEVIHGDYVAFVEESHADSVTQYELWKAIWSAIRTRNWWELAWALDRHDGFVERFAPWTFVGNHDVTRIASQVGDEWLGHALAVLMTVGGTPAVYYGDELALHGVKEEREGGDDAVRPRMPAAPDDVHDGGWALDLHRDLVALRRRHPWLHRATTRTVELENERFCYEVSDGSSRLVVGLNLTDDEWHAPGVVVGPRGWAVAEG